MIAYLIKKRFVRESNPLLQIDNLRCYQYTNEPDEGDIDKKTPQSLAGSVL